MKQFLLLGISILAVSACAPQAPPPPAAAVSAAQSAPGSPTNTTTSFDGIYTQGSSKTQVRVPGRAFRSALIWWCHRL